MTSGTRATVHPQQHPAEGPATAPVRTAGDRPDQRPRTSRPPAGSAGPAQTDHRPTIPNGSAPIRTPNPSRLVTIPARLAALLRHFCPKIVNFCVFFLMFTLSRNTFLHFSPFFCHILRFSAKTTQVRSATFCEFHTRKQGDAMNNNIYFITYK